MKLTASWNIPLFRLLVFDEQIITFIFEIRKIIIINLSTTILEKPSDTFSVQRNLYILVRKGNKSSLPAVSTDYFPCISKMMEKIYKTSMQSKFYMIKSLDICCPSIKKDTFIISSEMKSLTCWKYNRVANAIW